MNEIVKNQNNDSILNEDNSLNKTHYSHVKVQDHLYNCQNSITMRKYDKELTNEKNFLNDESIQTQDIIKNYLHTLKTDSVNE